MENSVSKTLWGGVRWEKLTQERISDPKCLEAYGYKTYSQNDEDGIIEEIFERIGTTNKVFVEFGVEDGLESNGHLLLHKGWTGLWIEGSAEHFESILHKFRPVLEKAQLKIANAFITKENINNTISEAGISGEIDLLSIDVDGNDYYIWDAISVIEPRVVVVEYNGKFPPSVEWKMAYDRNHIWCGTDWHGASLKALELLGRKLGYQLVGTNISGVNAFFVRQDLAEDKFCEPATAEKLYNPLRLELKHKNGHPASVCLMGQKDNYGIFQYDNEEVFSLAYGFHNIEIVNGKKYVWTSKKECAIQLNGSHLLGKRKLLIPYTTCISGLTMCMRLEDKILIRGGSIEKSGTIEVPLENVENPEKHMLYIQLSDMFVPSDKGMNDDRRSLGIYIQIDNIQII